MQILSKVFDLSQVMATLCRSAEMIKYVMVTEVCRIDRNSTVLCLTYCVDGGSVFVFVGTVSLFEASDWLTVSLSE